MPAGAARGPPAGLITRYAYDPLTGLLAEESDDAGWKVRYRYDSLGRATRIEQRDGSITDMEYDAADRVIREVRTGTGGVREETRRTYDALGRLVFVEGPGGALTEYRYADGPGGGCCGGRTTGPTMVIDPDGNVTRYEYDVEGRVVAVTDPTGARTTREYAPGGLLARSSDPARRTTTYDYDWNRRLSGVTDPASGATRYTYPLLRPDSAVDTVTDAESRLSRYTWGYGGSDYRSVAEARLPDSGRDWYLYDAAAGRLVGQGRANNAGINYVVDGAGRVQQVSYFDYRGVRPRGDVRYTYDTLGRISRVDDFSGRTEFAYDAAGRIAAETRTQDGRGYATRYAYDGLGNVTQMTYPSGLVVRFERQIGDPSRLSRVVAVDEVGVETILASAVNYTTGGLLTGYTMGNGLVYAIDRGPGGRVERITTGLPGDPSPDVLDLTYQYDTTGNITAILDAVDADRTAFYRYDALDRLVGADGWWGSLSWTYDRTGNRLSETRNGVLSSYAYQSSTSRLLEVRNTATGATEHTLAYDASGNATRYDDLLLDYDAADRLIRLRDRATTATVQENAHDHKFRRTKRTAYVDASGAPLPTPECTVFVYDLSDRLIAEHACATGARIAEYVYLQGYHVLAVRRGIAWYWYTSDHLPMPWKVVDARRDVAWNGRGEPWGRTLVEPSGVAQPLRFPGEYADGVVAYLWLRAYFPELGAFAAPEPLRSPGRPVAIRGRVEPGWFPGTVALRVAARRPSYSYAGSNPLRWIDPTGNEYETFCPEAGSLMDPAKPSRRQIAEQCAREREEYLRECAGSGDNVPGAVCPPPPGTTCEDRATAVEQECWRRAARNIVEGSTEGMMCDFILPVPGSGQPYFEDQDAPLPAN